MWRRMTPTLAWSDFQYLRRCLHCCIAAIAEIRLSFTYRHSPSTLAVMALSRTLNDMHVACLSGMKSQRTLRFYRQGNLYVERLQARAYKTIELSWAAEMP